MAVITGTMCRKEQTGDSKKNGRIEARYAPQHVQGFGRPLGAVTRYNMYSKAAVRTKISTGSEMAVSDGPEEINIACSLESGGALDS